MQYFSPSMTYREFKWTGWKQIQVLKTLSLQYEEDTNIYQIWGYNTPEVYVCFIYKNEVPQHIIDSGYSQEQNDVDKTDFETNFKATGNRLIPQDVKVISTIINNPFADKTITTAQGIKKLYARVHGIQTSLDSGTNTINFTIPYPWAKITGIMIYGGETLDKVDLSIYDTEAGTYSGVPNYKLNQFGFAANVGKDNFEWTSSYDADLYQGMIIRIVYTSISAKTVGINFILNECK